MTKKEFQKYLDRDGGCVHCGDTETAVPNHRANRGMGGSRERDVPSNVVVLCAALNGLIESSADWAEIARSYGWKLSASESAAESPYYDLKTGRWFLADNFYSRICYLKISSV
jgi:hypothetical protein